MKKDRPKLRFNRRLTVGILLFLAGILLICLFAGTMIRRGKQKLEKKTEEKMTMESEETITAGEAEEGIVYYQGKKYRYNSDLLNILVMGIDNADNFDSSEELGKAGQSDTNFLVLIDQKKREVQLVGISRDTMTEIEIYDDSGEYIRTVKEHLAIQYAYGDGGKQSCEMMTRAVSDLMYGLPIHGYCAMNMDGIEVLNEAVGGVPVTVLQTIRSGQVILKEGETVTLTGEQAHSYVRYREESFASNDQRIQRQKQYLSSCVQKIIEKTKTDLTLPFQLFYEMKDYMTTDISMDEITYLASGLTKYQIDLENIRSIPGEVVHPEDSLYEQFYVDEDGLYEMILELFYEEVAE